MKRVFYYSLCAVLCVSMLSAAIPVRVLAEEGRQQEAIAEQTDSSAADAPGDSQAGGINTNESGNELSQGESDTANPNSNQSELQASLASDMSPVTEQATKAAVSGYQHSDSATSGSVTLIVEWNDPVLGQPMTFHVSATGGSGSYLFRMDAPSYSNPNEYAYESVADPSRGEWTKYTDACASHDFMFTTTATGSYNFRFYLMDKASGVYYLRTNTYIQVADDAYPSVASIVDAAVSQAKQNTNGSEYEMALYLHDWLLDQLEYDNSLKWSSAESALTRGLGTCQAYESAYANLLSAAGIENAETRDTYDRHTWNAVKLDDEWYQVDCTWDDTSENFYGDLDQRHLYFCLTDELMAIAHPGHEKIYSADGYAARSTSLKDNYFVRNGKADEWAGKYFNRIQKHLNAREASFSIDADNQSFPLSISGIQNGIIAYAINLREWKSNAIKAELSASSKVIKSSCNKFDVKLNFEVTYQPKTDYEVFYHSAAASGASPQSTPVAYGRPTPTLTASELGFSNGSAKFLGWRAYRGWDNTWWATMPDGRAGWVALEDGRLPGGCSYRLLPDGWETGWSAWSGTVHLYASWDKAYDVRYHSAAASGASPQSTPVAYGRPTPTLTASELGFSNGSAKFLGWRAYRDWDNTWWATMPDGRAGWVALEDGRLPGGCSYRLLPDGWETGWSAWSGTVHLYASWDEH